MIASFKGHVAIVKLLIKAKAQLNTQLEVHCQNTTHLISTTICSVTYCEYCFVHRVVQLLYIWQFRKTRLRW